MLKKYQIKNVLELVELNQEIEDIKQEKAHL